MVYTDAREDSVARPGELADRVKRINSQLGTMSVSAIKGSVCRSYANRARSLSMARRELEDLRAAINFYDKEYGLDKVPVITLPPKPKARTRWLKRQEAASLLRAARSQPHLARYILIGLYTGSRSSAILNLHWMPSTVGGWIDLERGVMYRAGVGERVADNKRRPPVRLNPKLLAHMKRWQKSDGGIRRVVHWHAKPVSSVKKAFRSAREAAGLAEDVSPHVLRHTAATWLMQAGVPIWEVSGFLGMNQRTLETTYGHHHSDFQKGAANAY